MFAPISLGRLLDKLRASETQPTFPGTPMLLQEATELSIKMTSFPNNVELPQIAQLVIASFNEHHQAFDSRNNQSIQKSNEVLRVMEEPLERLHFSVEKAMQGTRKGEKVKKVPRHGVLVGNAFTHRLNVDAVNDEEKCVLEIEAGAAYHSGIFKDIISVSLLDNIEIFILAVPVLYVTNHKAEKRQVKDNHLYANAVKLFEKIYRSQRLLLPFRCVVVIGY